MLLIAGVMASCQHSQSVSKDLITGLSLSADGLTSETVYLSDGEQSIKTNEFVYGEMFYLIFDDVRGFVKEGDLVFPGMEIIVKDRKGNILIHEEDIYQDESDGTNLNPLQLEANFLIASPLHTDQIYTYYLRIWDKKGDGHIKANLRFKVVPNDAIEIISENVQYGEIYLYSTKSQRVITDNNIEVDETVILAIEGLDGFTSQNGKSSIGLGIKAVDKAGNVIVNEVDLVGDQPVDTAVVREALNPTLVISDASVVSPVRCSVVVWDKKSDNRIQLNTNFTLR